MSSYVCKKPISLGRNSYACGDIIPEGEILPERVLMLTKSGHITGIDSGLLDVVAEAITPLEPYGAKKDEIRIPVPITTENGTQVLLVGTETIAEAIRVMQLSVKEAEKEIAEIKDESTLIILNACDSRKGIKIVTEERATQLQPAEDKESETDQEDETSAGQMKMEDLEESAGDA